MVTGGLTTSAKGPFAAEAAGGAASDVRDRLIEAAAEVFAEKGYEGAGVQEIARRAGLTTGAIYSRFSGKAELLAAAIGAESGAQLDELLSPSAATMDAAELIRRVGEQLLTRPRSRKQFLLLEAFVAARRDPQLALILNEHLGEIRGVFGRLVERGTRAGDLAGDLDVDAAVHFCQAVALGFLLYEAIDTPRPDEAAWSDLLGRLVDALRPPDP